MAHKGCTALSQSEASIGEWPSWSAENRGRSLIVIARTVTFGDVTFPCEDKQEEAHEKISPVLFLCPVVEISSL